MLQALHDTLKLTHRGYIIPPRPEKNTVGGQRATEEFVETRRGNLQRYLSQLARHPVIGQSDVCLPDTLLGPNCGAPVAAQRSGLSFGASSDSVLNAVQLLGVVEPPFQRHTT